MTWKWAVLGFVAVALCACAGIPPEHAAAVLDTINEAERGGAMSAAQDQAAREALARAAEGVTWGEIGAWAGGVGLAALTSLTGVRFTRGPAKPMKGDDAAAFRAMFAGLRGADVAELRRRGVTALEAPPSGIRGRQTVSPSFAHVQSGSPPALRRRGRLVA